MPVSPDTLRAHIAVALKSSSKPVRKAFASSSWQEREAAERAITEQMIEALQAFGIDEKPAIIAPAPSRKVPGQ